MSRREQLFDPAQRRPLVLPSLLLCNFGNLEREVRQLEEAGVAALHLDVMDGHFVPNLTYGMPIVAAFRELTELPLDVHLMISEPDHYLEAFAEAGADTMTVHLEALDDPQRTLRRIRDLGAAAGLALNPSTPVSQALPLLESCDLGLVMSVEAGFGGQAFNPVALDKLREMRQAAGEEFVLQVDGGINQETIARCSEAGADWFVVGSGIFRQPDYGAAVRDLTSRAQSV